MSHAARMNESHTHMNVSRHTYKCVTSQRIRHFTSYCVTLHIVLSHVAFFFGNDLCHTAAVQILFSTTLASQHVDESRHTHE